MTSSARVRDPEVSPGLRRRDPSLRSRRRGRLGPIVQSILVWMLGTIGTVAIIWLLASWIFGLQLVTLATGSMSPTMPAGTAAIERTIDASELKIDDVISVHRAHDSQLVTHRVVEIDAADDPAQRTLTLRGDANETDDSERYVVAHVGLVMFAVPGLGYALAAATTPIGIALLATVIAGTMLWVLWPSRH